MNLNLSVKIKTPTMPNFIMPEDPNGFHIPVSELSEHQAKQVAALMSKTFMEHWKSKVKNNSKHK